MSAKTSWRAEGPIRGLYISVNQSANGKTRLGVTWITRERGDQPDQGHMWTYSQEYPKGIKDLGHAVSLAGWLARKAMSGGMSKRR